jgi:flagellar protein FlbD
MIKLTRLNKSEFLLNADLIEHIELTTDTVVTLTNGASFVVKEQAEEILDRIVQFRKRMLQAPVMPVSTREPVNRY